MSFQTCMHFYLMWNLKEDILKNAGNQRVDFPHWLTKYLFPYYGSQWGPTTVFSSQILKYILYRFGRTWGWLNYEKCYIFGWTVPLMMNLFITNNSLECGYLWFIVLLLSAVLTAPIHCRGFIGECDVMLNFSKSVPMKKHIHLYLGWGGVNFQKMFNFGWTIPLGSHLPFYG